jgi:hypothetical protein
MKVTLDKERELRLTNRKVLRLERLFESGITRILQLLQELQIGALAKVVYVCIEYGKDEKELSLTEVQDLILDRKDAGKGDDWVQFYGEVLSFVSDQLRVLKIFAERDEGSEKKTDDGSGEKTDDGTGN